MPTTPEELIVAVEHHRFGRTQEAEQICRKIIATDPNRADAWNLLGILAAQAGRHEEAMACFQEAVALNPDYAEAFCNLGSALKARGKLDEAVVAYGRALELRPDLAFSHNNLGTVLQAQGKLDNAIACYRRAVSVQPSYALAYVNLGSALLAQRQFEEAESCCRKALELNPQLAYSHVILGSALQAQGNLEQAVACFRRALQLKADLPAAYNNLATVLNHLGQFDEAVACCGRTLDLKPDYAEAHCNLANVYQQMGRFDDAQNHYRKALDLSPDFAYAHFGQGTLQLLTGDWKQGWPEYEWRLATNEIVPRPFAQPQWNGAALEGRTILLHAEQGLGDTIQFVRYAAAVKQHNAGATVIVECQRPLERLLASCPCMDRLVLQSEELPPFDVHVPLLSVPGILGTTPETILCDIPYLFAEPARIDRWRARLAPLRGLRIGVNWRGRSLTRRRDFPPACLRPLAELPGVQLISLQQGATGDEFAAISVSTRIVDLGDDFDTAHGAFMDTAAVMMNLDLVITSDTAIPHLAGALGVPVWLALPYVPDWRWLLDRSDSPWYPTMRLFRQKKLGDWAGVFEEIIAALRERIGP